MNDGRKQVEVVEVGPRDGFQSVGPFIPTEKKIAYLRGLHAAGIRRVEATSFVSVTAVPQLADAPEVLAAAQALPGFEVQVLVPTARHTERALCAGAREFAFVLSVSEAHNISNVRRTTLQSVEELRSIIRTLPDGHRLRLNLATAFDCPFSGRIDSKATLALLEHLIPLASNAEFALCDTTGRVTPQHVDELFNAVMSQFPEVRRWAFHAHDTYGLGVANVLAAIHSGVRVIDASIAGLGGCPFAPGATGNVATEDVVWTLDQMGFATGINLEGLLNVAHQVARLPGATTGGRIRHVFPK
jgi:hydroxymethylglutaryl-CoA lyase